MLLAPAVSEVAQEHAGLLRAGKVDVSAFPEIAESFDVQSLPTLVLIKDGSEVLRLTGFKGKAALAAAFAPHLEARTNPS
jgi:thioredoxin 1